MPRYFIDTEFIERPGHLDLLSLGIVAEDGRCNYWQRLDCDLTQASDWVRANVVPHLEHPNCYPSLRADHATDTPRCPWRTTPQIAAEVQQFCNPERYGKPEFWGYYADYDWVAFCWLFGAMVDLPKGFPMYCRDLKQWVDMLGNPKLPPQDTTEHHALADAQWTRTAWHFLKGYEAATGRKP